MCWEIAVPLGVLALCSCAAVQASCDPRRSLDVIRVDERNERLFVRADRRIADDPVAAALQIADARTYIDACKNGWSVGWSVSLFLSAERAGYQDDPALVAFVMDGSWAASYLAEYQNASGLLVTFPLDPARRKETKVANGTNP